MTTPMLLFVFAIFSPVFGDRWERAMGWCNHAGSELHLGDFNGDTILDFLCHDKSGNKWIAFADKHGRFSVTSWHKRMGWCSHAGSELRIGDFNGDGRSDMLCHDTRGRKWIAYANYKGNFDAGTGWHSNMGWCIHASAQLLIGDFNGDGRDDMMCHDKKTGYKWISFADINGHFKGTSWQRGMGWCNHPGSELHVGDFNGDSRTDILCHDTKGNKWIAFATCGGTFTGTNWHKPMGWCNHNGASVHIADFNGDGRDDMLCHDGSGRKWISYATVQGNFNGGTGFHQSMNWCHHSKAQFFVGDFDGDNHSDMLCHDKSTGYKWIAYATLTGKF